MRTVAVRMRPGMPLVAAMAAVSISFTIAYGVVQRSKPVVGLAVLPIAAVLLVRPKLGLLLAAVVAITVPHKTPHAWLLPPLLAAPALVTWREHIRIRRADVLFAALVAWLAATWKLHPEYGFSARAFLVQSLPLGLYIAGRAAGTRTLWWLLGAGTLAASTVLLEWVNGQVLFSDPSQYQWEGGAGAIYRPGGVFGGSPAAAIALAMIVLATSSLVRHRRRIVLGCQVVIGLAIFATFSRAGWVGVGLGVAVCLLLAPHRHSKRIAFLIACVALALASFGHLLFETNIYQEGVIRPGSTTARFEYIEKAWPLATDTTGHVLFGRGYNAFLSTTYHDPAVADAWVMKDGSFLGGPHNTYLSVLIEEGLVGLVLYLGWLVAAVRPALREALRLRPHSQERLLLSGLIGAAFVLVVAGLFHDLTHNIQVLTVGSLILGLAVSADGVRSSPSTESATDPVADDVDRRRMSSLRMQQEPSA